MSLQKEKSDSDLTQSSFCVKNNKQKSDYNSTNYEMLVVKKITFPKIYSEPSY